MTEKLGWRSASFFRGLVKDFRRPQLWILFAAERETIAGAPGATMAKDSGGALTRRIHDMDPDALTALISFGEVEQRRKIETTLPLQFLRPVTQVRKTFAAPRIRNLAESIAESGLNTRIAINAVNEDGARRYLDLLRLVWQAEHPLEDIPKAIVEGEEWYLIFTAGECRTRAFRWLSEHPCKRCKKEGLTACRHVDLNAIPVVISFQATPRQILKDQMIENSHERPDSHAEAMAYRAGFELERVSDPDLTPHGYAASIGHSPNAVYRALAYTALPGYIQEAVAEGKLGYEKALALARFHEARRDERELRAWLDFAVARPKLPTKALREHLALDLGNWKSGQLDLFSKREAKALEKKAKRSALDGQMRKDLARIREFLATVIRALARGELGRKDSPFSSLAANAAIVDIWDLLELILPQFLTDIPRKDQRRVLNIWRRYKGDVEWLRRQVARYEREGRVN